MPGELSLLCNYLSRETQIVQQHRNKNLFNKLPVLM